MRVVLIFARDTWNSLIALVLPRGCCQNSAAGNAPSWARLTKLAASMAVQAILGVFPAALVRYDHARKVFSLYLAMIVEIAYQRLSANPQAAVLL